MRKVVCEVVCVKVFEQLFDCLGNYLKLFLAQKFVVKMPEDNPYTGIRKRFYNKGLWQSSNNKRVRKCPICRRPHTLTHRRFLKYWNTKEKPDCLFEEGIPLDM